jgi:hypothetical protein
MVLVGKYEGKRQLERTSHRWKGKMKMDLQEIGWEVARTGLFWFRIETDDGLL